MTCDLICFGLIGLIVFSVVFVSLILVVYYWFGDLVGC